MRGQHTKKKEKKHYPTNPNPKQDQGLIGSCSRPLSSSHTPHPHTPHTTTGCVQDYAGHKNTTPCTHSAHKRCVVPDTQQHANAYVYEPPLIHRCTRVNSNAGDVSEATRRYVTTRIFCKCIRWQAHPRQPQPPHPATAGFVESTAP